MSVQAFAKTVQGAISHGLLAANVEAAQFRQMAEGLRRELGVADSAPDPASLSRALSEAVAGLAAQSEGLRPDVPIDALRARLGARTAALQKLDKALAVANGQAPVDTPSMQCLRALMGDANVIGPEDIKSVFGVTDVGEVPPLPPCISFEFLNSLWPTPGKTIAETHFLAFVPASLDGKPQTIREFAERANTLCKEKNMGPAIDNPQWLSAQSFAAGCPKVRGEWVLLPREDAPCMRGYPGDLTRSARSQILAVGLRYLCTGEKVSLLIECDDRTNKNIPVRIGSFTDSGLVISYDGAFRDSMEHAQKVA